MGDVPEPVIGVVKELVEGKRVGRQEELLGDKLPGVRGGMAGPREDVLQAMVQGEGKGGGKTTELQILHTHSIYGGHGYTMAMARVGA